MEVKKVSIIVTTFFEKTKPYLDLCIKSVENLDYPKDRLEIILVGKKSYQPTYENVKTVAPDKDEFGNSEGINFGVSHASKDSGFYFIINDDCILTKNSLKNMVECVGDSDSILNPISPCDNGSAYQLRFHVNKGDKVYQLNDSFYRLGDLSEFTNELVNAESLYPSGAIRQAILCMFATLIPKKVWDKIGPWDENFKTGQDDIDYSFRAQANKVGLFVCLNALVWHFGGVSTSEGISMEKRKENVRYFKKKWGTLPPYVTEDFLDSTEPQALPTISLVNRSLVSDNN